MATRLDKQPLIEAEEHIKTLKAFLHAVEQEKRGKLEDKEKVINTLSYALKIVKQHKQNLLHCYEIAERWG